MREWNASASDGSCRITDGGWGEEGGKVEVVYEDGIYGRKYVGYLVLGKVYRGRCREFWLLQKFRVGSRNNFRRIGKSRRGDRGISWKYSPGKYLVAPSLSKDILLLFYNTHLLYTVIFIYCIYFHFIFVSFVLADK